MILDALTYVIDADSRDLDKSIKSSEKGVDNLTKSMTEAEKKSKDMEQKMRAGFARIGSAILATVAVSKLLSTISDYAKTTEAVRTVSENIGVAIEDVDAFGQSVERMGGTAQGAQVSLSMLTQRIGRGLNDPAGAAAKRMSEMGVSLRDASGAARETMDVILDLSDSLAGMSRSEAAARLADLGITDQKTIELLVQGRKEVDRMMRLQKENGVVTKEAAERVRQYTLAMARFRQATSNASDGIVSIMVPIVTRLINGLSSVAEWVNRHGHVVKGFFIGLATVLTVTYLPAIISAAASTWALLAPFLAVAAPISALIGLFALLYDDIMNFIAGNDSLIAKVLDKYPVIVNVIKSMVSVFNQGLDAGKKLARGLTDVFTVMAFEVKSIFQGIIDFISGAWDFISGIYDKTIGAVSSLGSWLGGKLGFSTNNANAQLSAASASPINSVTSNSISHMNNNRRETNVSVGEVNVQTQAADAEGISRDISGGLSKQLRNLQTEAASGVAR